jgi:ribonuclease P protein component
VRVPPRSAAFGGRDVRAVALLTLKKRSEFLRVRGGRRWSSPAFVLEARSRPQDAPGPQDARFGFTVSKQVGSAVVRNRVRRRLRALAAALEPSQVRQGYDYVIIARPAAAARAYRDLRADLELALTRVHQSPTTKGRNRSAE